MTALTALVNMIFVCHMLRVGGAFRLILELLKPWLNAFRFVKDSATLIQNGVQEHDLEGKSFRMSTPARWIVVAMSGAVLEELKNADEKVLSMQAAANERNSTEYILSSSIHSHPYHLGIIRKNLTQKIYETLPYSVEEIRKIFSDSANIGKEWSQICIHQLIIQCITAITNRALLGGALADDQDYLRSLSSLSKSISRAGLIIDLAPRCMKSILAQVLVPKSGQMNFFIMKLAPLFEERRESMNIFGNNWEKKPNDAIQWILETAPPESSLYELCIRVLYIYVSAIHTSATSMVNVLCDLAAHPEFQSPIRSEVERVLKEFGGWKKPALEQMDNLDSSLRESMRLHPVTTATMMRKAKQDCVLADGTYLYKGQWVVAPAWALNRSAQIYSNPNTYDALRFSSMMDKPTNRERHKLSTPGDGYLSFGAGRHACPGRFFAAIALKTLLGQILCTYDFKLCNEDQIGPQRRFLLFSCFPDIGAKLLFRKISVTGQPLDGDS